MSDGLRQLTRDAYPDLLQRLSILTMIEDHLEVLNTNCRYQAAAEFLQENENSIREEALRRKKAERRATFRLVSGTAISALLLAILDWLII